MKFMKRRAFLSAATSAAVGLVTSCKNDETPIGPTIAPADLAARLDEVSAGKLAVFYVGPDALFARGHVPGAKNVGEVSTPAGKRALEAAMKALPADTSVVLYCGCCPYKNCPNVRPASEIIRASGRKNASVLDLPTRFSTDWSDKGLPVDKS